MKLAVNALVAFSALVVGTAKSDISAIKASVSDDGGMCIPVCASEPIACPPRHTPEKFDDCYTCCYLD